MNLSLGFKFLAILGVVALVGCGGPDGPKLAPVKGKVLYKDSPLSGANVTFLYPDGEMAAGRTDAAGEFTLTTQGRVGAPLGKAEVLVSKEAESANPVDTKTMTPEDYQKMAQAGKMPTQAASTKSPIPERYRQKGKSGLEATVVADESQNNLVFPLVD